MPATRGLLFFAKGQLVLIAADPSLLCNRYCLMLFGITRPNTLRQSLTSESDASNGYCLKQLELCVWS
jgi:hypothetical protein